MATLALGLWIKDKPVLGSIIRLKDIEVPRKDFEKYEEGEIVDMRCRGFKGIHKCLLGRIGGEDDREKFQEDLRGEGFARILTQYNLYDFDKGETSLKENAKDDYDGKTEKKRKPTKKVELESSTKKKRKNPKNVMERASKTLEQISAELDLTELQDSINNSTSQISEDNGEHSKIGSVISAFKTPTRSSPKKFDHTLVSESMMVVDDEGVTAELEGVTHPETVQPENPASCSKCGCDPTLADQVSRIWWWIGTLDQRMTWSSQQLAAQQQNPQQMFGYNDSNNYTGGSNYSSPIMPQQHHNPQINQAQSEVHQVMYGSYTKNQLLSKISGVGEYSKAAKVLFRTLYTPEEYRGRSLLGGRPNAKYDQRPCLEDTSKLEIIYEIIKEKYSMNQAAVKEKIREILKPSRT